MDTLVVIYGRKGTKGYHPHWNSFSQRQKQIIRGVKVKGLRVIELVTIMEKAKDWEMPLVFDIVCEMYEEMVADVEPKYTISEALEVLQRLTPWERKNSYL